MLGSHVENVNLSLKSRDDQFVHFDVFPVELETTNSIKKVMIPDQLIFT